MKKRLCLLALCLAALLGLSLFFVACDDEPAPGPTPVEHTHSYTSVTIAMADYMGMKGENAGKFIKDVAVPCSGEDCDSTLTLTKDELNAVFAAIMEDQDAADYTAKVEGGNYIASFKVTKGEYTVTVNMTQPHTHTFLETTISFDEYIDMANETWKKPLEVPCFYSPRGCTGKLTFTVGDLNAQMEQNPVPVDETTVKFTLTKDDHTVTVTVTGVPASEDPGPDEPEPPVASPFSIAVKIGQEGLVDDATYTYCVGTTVAYTVTVTDTRTGEPVTGADLLQYLSATYQIDDGDAVGFTQQAANFTFATVGTYTIVVTYDNGVDEPATFTCTAEVSEHEGTYYAATSATCTEKGNKAYIQCESCNKYFEVEGEESSYTVKGSAQDSASAFEIAIDLTVAGHGETNLTFTPAAVATCTASAHSAYVYCSVCEKYYEVTAGTSLGDCTLSTEAKDSANAFDSGDPAAHTYAYTATAAEYQAGSKQVNCTYDGCNQTVEITLPELTKEGVWQKEQTSAATCTAAVVYTYTATVENVKVTVTGVSEGDPLGHDLEWKKDEIQHWRACKRDGCNYTTTAENHTLTTKPGTDCHYQTCETCGYVGEQQEHVGNYTYDAESKDVLFTCSKCGTTSHCAITGLTLTGDNVTVDGNNVSGVTVTAEYCAVTGVTATAVDVTEYVAFTVSSKAGDTGCEYTIQAQIDGVEAAIGTMTFTKDHQYDAVALNEQTAAVEQTCSVCDGVNTIATLTELSVDWAEAAAGSYTVGATIQPADFEVSYTYSADVTAYADTIEAAITDNIGTLSTATAGIVTVEFQLGDKTASIEVRVYDELFGGIGIWQAQEGVVTSALAQGYDVAAVPNAASDGFAVSFWMTGNTGVDWTSIVIGGKGDLIGFDITLPNLDPNDYGNGWNTNAYPTLEGVNALYNGAVYSDMLRTPGFITVSVDPVNGVSYYLNGILRVRYEMTDKLANGKGVNEFVQILTAGVAEDGFQFAYNLLTEDLYVTNGLNDAQAAAMFAAYKASDNFPLAGLDTTALMNGMDVVVYESADANFDADGIYRLNAIENVAQTGLSVSFDLSALVVDEWKAIVIGTEIDIDVTLACLDAFGNTSGTVASCNAAPETSLAQYFKSNMGWVTLTLEADGDIAFYCDGQPVATLAGNTFVWDFTLNDVGGAVSTELFVSDVVNAIFGAIAESGCDLLEGVTVAGVLVTGALDATAAQTLYTNYSVQAAA